MQKLDLGVEFDPEQTDGAVAPEGVVPPTPGTQAMSSQPVMRQSRTQTSTQPMKTNNNRSLSTIVLVVALAAGALTGLGAFKLKAKASGLGSGEPLKQVAGSADSIKAGDVFGSANESTFKDSAEGYLQIGGFQGEGSHHIVRPGGDSQTVYLVSSITDLDKFDGMQVKVWGETNKGQKVGWLMDVGRIQVIDPHATAPAGSSAATDQGQDQ